jgi:hypothetical protein
MLVQLSTPLLATLLFSTINAAPTRTHCRCSIVSDAPSPATYTPSSAHWSPANPSSNRIAAVDICESLGPELERIQHTKPELYDSYISPAKAPSIDDEHRPLPTSVLMEFPNRNEAQPTSLPQQRIVCYSEPELFSTFQSSFFNLWALQITIAVLILICVAEGAQLGMRWYVNSQHCSRKLVLTV